ncbi:MAG TPA: hypothetical protein VGI14_05200 [Casimicrobiaceae bacterium]|jgi:hypothetical protein
MKRALRDVVMALVAATALPAWACGVCVEDKVAATYDHAVVTRAVERRHVVVFAAIEGSGDAQALSRRVRNAASRSAGVDRSSVRASADPAALSFALDPRAAAPEAALAAIEKAASAPGLKLELLRVAR